MIKSIMVVLTGRDKADVADAVGCYWSAGGREKERKLMCHD
jgi:hypothetical protein